MNRKLRNKKLAKMNEKERIRKLGCGNSNMIDLTPRQRRDDKSSRCGEDFLCSVCKGRIVRQIVNLSTEDMLTFTNLMRKDSQNINKASLGGKDGS